MRVGIESVRHIKSIAFDVFADNEPGAAAQSQTFSLPDGMEPITFMFTQFFTRFEFYDITLFFSQIIPDKLVVIDISQEADTLTVFSFGTGQPCILGNGAYFAFHEASEGKHQFRNLQSIELGEKIGLVFYRIYCCPQIGDTVLFDDAGIMSCCNFIEIFPPILFEKTELDVFVAHYIGIGGKAAFDRVEGISHDILPVFVVKRYDFESATVFAGRVTDNFYIFFGMAVKAFILVFHTDTYVEEGRVVSGFF